jgi:two-component system, OmpR family, alkaline phosphatase synthesis response regulator PhoP
MEKKINIIEDDEEIARIETLALQKEGYAVTRFGDCHSFWLAFANARPDLILLDLMLPDASGLDLLKQLRNNPNNDDIDVLIVSAKGQLSDKVKGLDLGADDYLEKPFSVLELASRVNARFRKKRANAVYVFAGFTLNLVAHTLSDKNGERIELTPKEWDLLSLLVMEQGKAFSREELFSHLWGEGAYESRTLDMHIMSLRKKLGDKEGKLLETVYGVGYRIRL